MMTSSNGNNFRITGHLCGGIYRWSEFPSQSRWRGALMFSLICSWVNKQDVGDLGRHHAHYDVTVMISDRNFAKTINEWLLMMELISPAVPQSIYQIVCRQFTGGYINPSAHWAWTHTMYLNTCVSACQFYSRTEMRKRSIKIHSAHYGMVFLVI